MWWAVQMQLGMVGLDLVLLVMGRELVSFKIVDAALTVDVASASEAETGSNPSAVTIGLTVEDMSLRDMQAGLSSCKPSNFPALMAVFLEHRAQVAFAIYSWGLGGCHSLRVYMNRKDCQNGLAQNLHTCLQGSPSLCRWNIMSGWADMLVMLLHCPMSPTCQGVQMVLRCFAGMAQARPEHSMVLRPNSAAESCSLTLEYTQPVKRSQPPSLIIEMANPRMLVLFRCACILLAPVHLSSCPLDKSTKRFDSIGWASIK